MSGIEESRAMIATQRARRIGDHHLACLIMICPKRRLWGRSDVCYSAGHGQRYCRQPGRRGQESCLRHKRPTDLVEPQIGHDEQVFIG